MSKQHPMESITMNYSQFYQSITLLHQSQFLLLYFADAKFISSENIVKRVNFTQYPR